MTRQADISWLKNWFAAEGFTLKAHFAGQFTELYSRFRFKWVRATIHLFNAFWFGFVRSPRLAFANILIVQKP